MKSVPGQSWIIGLLLLGSSVCAAPAPKGKDANPGKSLYTAKCASCHAKDGKGSAAMAKMYKLDAAKLNLLSEQSQKLADADLAKLIADGKGKMPKFEGKLKKEDINSIVAYIRSLKP